MGFLVNPYRFASGSGWDFSDNDMEDSWSLGNNTISSNKMNCSGQAYSSTVYYGSIDPMGATASDTSWILWTTINFSDLTLGSYGGNAQQVCFSDESDTSQSTNQDGIGIRAMFDFGGGGSKTWRANAVNGAKFEGGSIFSSPTLATGVDYYLQIIRLSATTCNCGIYSDYDRSTLIDSETPTVSSSTVNLRYIKMMNMIGFNSGTPMVSTVNGVNFSDGVTAPP